MSEGEQCFCEFHKKGVAGGPGVLCRSLIGTKRRKCKTGKEAIEDGDH